MISLTDLWPQAKTTKLATTTQYHELNLYCFGFTYVDLKVCWSREKNRWHYLVRIYSFAFYIPPDQISVKIFLYYFELLVHASFTILIGASCCTLSKMRFFLIIYLKTFWRLCFMQSLKRRILSYLGPTVK